jgi:hypothetical protein
MIDCHVSVGQNVPEGDCVPPLRNTFRDFRRYLCQLIDRFAYDLEFTLDR